MWEALHTLPRGRLSTRNVIKFVTATLVATFVYLIATTTPVQALNTTAVWEDDQTISYSHDDKKDYTYKHRQDIPSNLVPVVGDGAQTFLATTTPHEDKSILEDCTYRFIYFKSGVDYNTAPKASYVDFFSATCDAVAAVDAGPQNEKVIDITPRESLFDDTLTEEQSSCGIFGVGWIICSMSTWVAEGMDFLYGVLGGFFKVAPLTTTQGSLYDIWGVSRNFANAAFVIVALIMIYSIMTGGLMSNYGIKRLLPRLLLGAVLVNTSYWICAVAIDLSNILGVEIQNLLISIRDASGAANPNIPQWKDITALVLGGGTLALGAGIGTLAVTGGAIAGLAWLLLGAMIPAIFAALVAVMILAARQALIVVLVALAPLAFVMYLLPNTEEWFHRWRKGLTVLLVMFPAFSLIFGGSQLAGLLIIQNANGSVIVAILGLAVQAVPLFITPFLIRLSSGIMGTIAGMVNDRQKGLFDRAKNFTDENRKLHQQRGLASRRRDGSIKRGWQGTTGAAQALDRRRRRRERMTGAYEKTAQSNFEGFRTGREVVMEEKAAETRGEEATASNELLWQRRLAGHSGAGGRTRGQQRRRALEYNQLHHAHEHAHIDKGLAKVVQDNQHGYAERALQQRIQNPAGPYRNIKMDAQVQEGLAKVYESDYMNQAELNLQQAIYNPAGAFRGMAVNAQVQQGLAKNLETNYQSQAQQQLQNIINTAGSAHRAVAVHSHITEGLAKVAEEQYRADAERELQQTVADRAGPYRNMKVQTDVAQQDADFLKSNVQAEGKAEFKRQFADGGAGSAALGMSARELRQMNVETTMLDKEAELRDSIISNRAQAAWNQEMHTSGTVARGLKLADVSADDSKKLEEERVSTLIENIRAQGADAPTVTAAERAFANSIEKLHEDIEVQEKAIESAKLVQRDNLASEFKTDAALRDRAGGIGGVQAQNRIYARAKKEVVSAYMEDVSNSRSILSEYTIDELVELHVNGRDRQGNPIGDNTALEDAAMQEILLNKGNNWALQKVRDRVADMGMIYEDGSYYDLQRDPATGEAIRDPVTGATQRGAEITDQAEVERRRDVQQIFADAAKQSKLRLSNLSAADLGNFESGTSVTNSQEAIIRDILRGKFDQQKIVTMDVDELQRMVQVLRSDDVRDHINSEDPEALNNLLEAIDGAQRNKQINGQIKDRERGVMNAVAAHIDPADTRPADEKERSYFIDPAQDNARVSPGSLPDAAERTAPVVAPSDYNITSQ